MGYAMKKMTLALAAAGAATMLPTASQAAPFINMAAGSGTYGNSSVTCSGSGSCPFSDTITFMTPSGYNLVSLTLSSAQVGADPATNIDFTSATLNGVAFSTIVTGFVEFRQLLNQAIVAGGTNTLVISGTTGGNGSYSGALSFATAVPEPAVWSLLVLGFGVAGYAMRRRPTARFAKAA